MSEVSARTGRRWRVSRRGFLIGAGVAGSGLALGIFYGIPEARLAIARSLDNSAAPGRVEAPPDVWFEISPADRITLYLPKVEMGQGVHTALAQIAAEELEVEWGQLGVVQASTARGLRDRTGTASSNTVSSLFIPLREAAATLREMLRAEAARRWGLELHQAVAMDGVIFRSDRPSERLTYSQVVEGATDWEVPEDAPQLKPVREFRYIGRSMARLDLPDKLTGRAVYGFDVRVPGMVYGAVARPPRLNSRLKRAAVGRAAEQPGVVSVVAEEAFAGIVATSRKEAYDALEGLELEWEEGGGVDQADIIRLTTVQDGKGVVIQREGRPAAALRRGRIVEAEYRTPMAAHAHLEPQAAMVDVRPDKVVAQVATQSPDAMRDALAELLGRPKERVEVTATYLGGGFGRKLVVESALEAARLSAASGRPVHVGWNRTEEFRHGSFRPPTHHVLRASLGAGGAIQAMEHQLASGDVAFSLLPAVAAVVMGADFGAWRGATIPYQIPHRRARSQRVELPVSTTWWRGLGLLANTFAIESFMDELAVESGEEPLTFRLNHLGEDELSERIRRALIVAAEASGWGERPSEGRARGLACCIDVNTVVAQVAEVSLEPRGRVRVHRMTAAVDPGLVINPDGVRAQTQGAIVMGLSSTFLERVMIRDGRVEAGNFDRYPLFTMAETPEIDVHLTGTGSEPYGVGEPPIGPVAAAVANALFALTGERFRELPLVLEG
ncbi:MAG: xanthine dehydrogenase family protein molybdopterin-binding subunit [Trueperaceae bacterium]|nr:MAG: xanthine dehydrogenase family protein molybdopterin-binding subunit [Trueperaceae bacterium]